MGSISLTPTSSIKENHHIVCLDAYLCPVPRFSIPHTYTEHYNTSAYEIIPRIKDATIIITTRVPISATTLASCSPNLRLISVMGIGFDIIDVAACRERGIVVCNSPAASGESVAEHAIALYFAAKRRIVELHAIVTEGVEWPERKSGFSLFPRMPVTCRKEVMAIVGYGALGKLIEGMSRALGMKVLISDRKGAAGSEVRAGRTPFVEALSSCSVLVIACPLDDGSRNMITETELRSMKPSATLINVARGGVVDEHALVKALKEGWIAAAATDVFTVEPATKTSSPLTADDVPNLTLSPHIAWYADASLEKLQEQVKANIEGFAAGEPIHLVTGSFDPTKNNVSTNSTQMKIAIIINTDEVPYRAMMEGGYRDIFSKIEPTTTLEFYDPIGAQQYPLDLSSYTLLVIGGGTYIIDESLEWYQKEMRLLASLPKEYPSLKVVGICFGHQKMAEVFGGKMEYMNSPELGVTPLQLNVQGHKFFDFLPIGTPLNLYEFHQREVTDLAPGFRPLAENNQICLSETNTILSFQGHPEMSNELATALLNSSSSYTEKEGKEKVRGAVESLRNANHGVDVWRRILTWVQE